DDFADELSAAGVHEEQFRFGCHGLICLAVLEGVADFLADGRATRFAQQLDGPAERAQALREQRDLRRLAASLCAFKRNKQTFHIKNAYQNASSGSARRGSLSALRRFNFFPAE